jgi:predicted phosphodiesterase
VIDRRNFLRGAGATAALAAVGVRPRLAQGVLDASAPYGVHLSHTGDTQRSLTVTWFTEGTADPKPRLFWSSAGKSGEIAASSHAAFPGDPALAAEHGWKLARVRVHVATVDGLEPRQELTYTVRGASGDRGPFTTRTAPTRSEVQRIVVFGDHAVRRESARTSALVKLRKPDLVVIAGDLSYANGNQPIWDDYFRMHEPLFATVPVMAIPGNHETNDGTRYAAFTSRMSHPGKQIFYAFDHGNAHFLMVESEADTLNSNELHEMLALMETDLASAAVRRAAGEIDYVALVQHVPLWSNHETRHNSWPHVALEEQYLQRYAVDLLLTGHNHHYERSKPMAYAQPTTDETKSYESPKGTIEIIAGGGGAGLYEFAPDVDGELPTSLLVPGQDVQPWSAALVKRFSFAELDLRGASIRGRGIASDLGDPANPATWTANAMQVIDEWSLAGTRSAPQTSAAPRSRRVA